MLRALPTTALVLATLAVAATARSEQPDFCRSGNCPPYTVVSTEVGYELRRYEAATWASTSRNGMSYSYASWESFNALYDYINGSNQEKAKIHMTAPVLGKVTADDSFGYAGDFEFSFYMAGTPATPIADSGVSITTTPQNLEVYVSWFPGFADPDDWKEAAIGLRAHLDRAGYAYEKSFYYTAGYDSPFHLFNRHNEIWIVKKN